MQLTGGQMIVKYLEREQVPYALGIPGHGILSFFDALKESDDAEKVKYLQVKHEQTAAHIADAYFRITGKPLAVFTSIGPGMLNTAIGLGTAYVDSSAFLLLSGDTHVHMKGTGVLQEVERYQDSNILRAMEPLTKRSWRVENVEQLPRIMQRAFNKMCTGRSGPVAISLPMDVQAESLDVQLPQPQAHKAQAGPAASQEAIEQAIALMETAKRPVILAGGAVLRSRQFEQLQDLAERWGAAVVTTMAGKSAFPEAHPLNGYHTGSKGTPVGLTLTRNADVILALGTRFADETTCSYRDGVAFKKGTKLIHVDFDAGEIGKNYPCEVGVVGDMYRSILEGIAMTMRNYFEAMCSQVSVKPDQIIVSGGGSNGDLFMQIFADVFGIPAVRNVMNGAAGLGAAICAAVATGIYSDFEQAAAKMVHIRDRFLPNMENHALYTRINDEVYRDITSVTDSILKKTHPIFD